MQDNTEITTTTSLKRIAKKSSMLMIINTIGISEDFISTLLLSKHGQASLGASTFILTANNFIIDPLAMLTNQNAAFLAKTYGELKALPLTEPEQIAELSARIGIIIRQGWLLAILSSLPSLAAVLAIKPTLLALGQSPEISQLAADYFYPAAFAVPMQSVLNINERFLPSVDLEKWLLPYKTILTAVGIGLTVLLVPRYGSTGAGLAVLGQSITGLLATTLFMLLKQDLAAFQIFKTKLALSSEPYYKEMLKQGYPITLAQIGINGASFGISIIVGHLGNFRLALERVALQYFGVLTTISHGVNDASYRIVAQNFGAKQYSLMARYGNLGIFISAALFTAAAIGVDIFAKPLAAAFLGRESAEENETLIRYVFLITSIGKLFSVILEGSSLNLAALQDTFLASAITLLSTLTLILPLSALITYLTDLDIYGISGAIAIGMLLSSAVTTGHWLKQSHVAINKNSFEIQETSNFKVTSLLKNLSIFKCAGKSPTPQAVERDPEIQRLVMNS